MFQQFRPTFSLPTVFGTFAISFPVKFNFLRCCAFPIPAGIFLIILFGISTTSNIGVSSKTTGETPTQKLNRGFSEFGSKVSGSSLVSIQMIFQVPFTKIKNPKNPGIHPMYFSYLHCHIILEVSFSLKEYRI